MHIKKFRSNVSLSILAAALALVLASCEIRAHTDLVVEEDESGVLSAEISVDEEFFSMAGMAGGEMIPDEMFPDEMFSDEMLPGEGWSIEPVTGDYTGMRISFAFDSFDDLRAQMDGMANATAGSLGDILGEEAGASDLADLAAGGIMSDFSLTRDGGAFVFRMTVPDAEGMMDESEEGMIDMSMLEEVFDIRFALTLPGEIVSSNADVVTGQTLIWELSLDGGRDLEARSELPGTDTGPIIILLVIVLVAAAAVYIAFDRRRRQAAASVPAAPAPSEPEEEAPSEES